MRSRFRQYRGRAALAVILGAAIGVPIILKQTGGSIVTPPPPGTASAFFSANGSDLGANCKRFTAPTTNPDPSGVTDCLSPDKAYKLVNPGERVEAECNGSFVGDDITIGYDSTKAASTQYVTFVPSTSCPNGPLGVPQWTLGAHTTTTSQFTMLGGGVSNTIPVASTAGFKIPGKVYLGWDMWGNCTGATSTSFTGCVAAGSTFSIVWNSGLDVKQGNLLVAGPSYLDLEGLNAAYRFEVSRDALNLSCPASTTTHVSNHVIVNGVSATRFFVNGDDVTVSNALIGNDNSANNAKISTRCLNVGGTNTTTRSTNVLLDNVHFKDMSDQACNIAATQAAFPAEANQFCHNECLYLSDTTGLQINNSWFNGCSIIDLFCSDDAGLGINLTMRNTIMETPKWNPSNTINCHTDTAGLITNQTFVNNDLPGAGIIFQSGSGGKVNLVWANNVGSSPGCTSSVFNTIVFTNNVTFGSAIGCATNNLLSSAAAEWTNATAGDYSLPSTAAAVDHASATYAPATDKAGRSIRCGVAADAGALEYCPPTVTGASLAACTGTCADPGYIPDATTVGCAHGASVAQNTSLHVVTLGDINNGTTNECRQYTYLVPTNLNPSSSNKPAAFLVAGNPARTTCGPGGNDEFKSVFNGTGVNTVAAANRFVVIVLAKPCNPSRSSWLHPAIDVPAGGATPTDGPYISAVVSDIESRFNIDPQRIYLGGDSSGGGLVNGIACEDPYSSLFRGYAPEANLMSIQGSSTVSPTGPVAGTERCASTNRNFFYINANGSADTQVPPGGTCLPTHCIDSLAQTGAFWASHMGCSSTATTTSFGSPTAANTRVTYGTCTFPGAGIAVATNLVNGGIHSSAGITSNAYNGGTCTVCNDYYWTREVWAYFANSTWAP